MKRVREAPIGIEVDAVNCRTGATDDSAKFTFIVIEVKEKVLVDWAPVAIAPEATPADAVVSASVCTVMPVALPAVAAPIVRPRRVIVKIVPAAMPAVSVVMTI